jgi:hypothetical protein
VQNSKPVANQTGKNTGESDGGSRREALAFVGIDPQSGQQRPIQLAYEKLRDLPRRGLGKVKEAGYIVPEVLGKPTAIFQGLTHDEDEPRRGEGWLCYVGRPTISFEDDGRAVPPRSNRVFLVFVNAEWVAYNWYWYAADPYDGSLPLDHAERFRKRLL